LKIIKQEIKKRDEKLEKNSKSSKVVELSQNIKHMIKFAKADEEKLKKIHEKYSKKTVRIYISNKRFSKHLMKKLFKPKK
jgi:hypothetical protein